MRKEDKPDARGRRETKGRDRRDEVERKGVVDERGDMSGIETIGQRGLLGLLRLSVNNLNTIA